MTKKTADSIVLLVIFGAIIGLAILIVVSGADATKLLCPGTGTVIVCLVLVSILKSGAKTGVEEANRQVPSSDPVQPVHGFPVAPVNDGPGRYRIDGVDRESKLDTTIMSRLTAPPMQKPKRSSKGSSSRLSPKSKSACGLQSWPLSVYILFSFQLIKHPFIMGSLGQRGAPMKSWIILLAVLALTLQLAPVRAEIPESNESRLIRQKIWLGFNFIGLKDARQFMHDDPDLKPLTDVLPKWNSGIFVTSVNPEGPAEQADIHRADILTKIGDMPIKSTADLVVFANTAQPSLQYPIVFFRYSDESSSWVKKTTNLAGEAPRAEEDKPTSRPSQEAFVDDPRAPHGKLSGGAWLTKNDGSSTVLRGLHIFLLRRTISGNRVAQVMRKQISKWHGLIEQNPDQDSTEEKKKIREIDAFVRDHPDEMDLVEAYKLLKSHSISRLARDLPLDSTIKPTSADMDGKFSLSAQVGDYYVYSSFGSKTLWVDWLVPVTIKADNAISINLSEENAATLRQLDDN